MSKQNTFWHFAITITLKSNILLTEVLLKCHSEVKVPFCYISFTRNQKNPQCSVSGSTECSNTNPNQVVTTQFQLLNNRNLLYLVSRESNVLAGKASEVVVNKHHG